MTLNNPIAFAFAAVIPVIIALYLLRLKRKRKVVSSTFFWTEMVQDLQANVPFQKLRWNILLLLQVLIALAIILAMLDLGVRAALNEGQRTIFVIDTSASMSALDGSSTRFDNAVTDIKSYCRNLSDREQVMIIEAGEYAQVLLDFTNRFPSVERSLNSLHTQDTRSDMATAFALAVSRASEVDKPEIVIVSDLAGMDSGLFDDSQYPISFLQTGSPARNVAITDFLITGIVQTEDALGFNAFITIRNYIDNPVSCSLEFYIAGELVDVRPIEIDADSRVSRVFTNIPFNEGVVEVRLDFDDDLPLDNVAYALPPLADLMQVLVAGDDPFLVYALAGIPGIQLFTIDASDYVPGAGYDLTFFPGWAPEVLPAGNYVFFNPPDRDWLPCEVTGTVINPSVTDWNDGHPMLRFVNPGSFNVFSASDITPLPGSLVLIDADNTSLMVYGERNYLRALVFPFDLTSTDIITRPTFPILMFNVISFFRSFHDTGTAGLRTQGIEAVRVDTLGDKVRLHSPDGSVLEFPVEAGHAFIDVNLAGIYRMEIEGDDGTDEKLLVVNFFDENESDVSSIPELSEEIDSDQVMRFEIEGEKRIWKWLSVIALIILTSEWFFYHRKGF